MRVVVLGSGSGGNSTLVEGPRGRLLIDCGLSARETARRLARVGCDPMAIDAVVISHEHSDHVRGAAMFSRRYGVPLYVTADTAVAAGLSPDGVAGLVHTEAGRAFSVGGLDVHPFSVPHDAVDNVGLIVECEGTRLGYATDLGHPSKLVLQRLMDCDVLVTEANHDPGMLRDGPYPWSVKQRILGRHGHLSNEEMANVVAAVATARTRHLFLAHMSETNNTPGLALEAGRRALEEAGRCGVRVHVARQDSVSEVAEA